MATLALDPLALLADLIDPRPDPYLDDPVGWLRDRLEGFAWSKQRAIMESVRDNRRTAVHSAHDLGKSYIAASIAAWWIDVHPVGQAFVASTAPTYKQVHSILWEEVRKAHRKGQLRGVVNQSDVWKITDEEVGYGRKPADTDEHGFQGIHRRYVLAIIDEACGVPTQLYNAVEAITTNRDCRILAIGNPDQPDTEFAKVCAPLSTWNVIHLDGLESPNFTGEQVPEWLSPLLLDPEWVDDKRRSWGEDSAIFRSKVRGLFTIDAEDAVVPASWVARCRIGVDRPQDVEAALQPVELGVDVGAGGDESVITERRGPKAGQVWRDRQPDTMRVVGLAVRAVAETGATRVKVDLIGIGKGVHDRLLEMKREGHPALRTVEIIGVNVGEASSAPDRFPRLRDQLWWEVGRELSESGGWDLSAVGDDAAVQLAAPKYALDSSGRIKVEPKEETRKRLGRSPDDADSLLLAFYTPPARPRARIRR